MNEKRTSTVLEPMSDADFAAFVVETIPAFAADKVTSGQWAPEHSLELARQAFAELLPEGLATPNNYLFNVLDDRGRCVGSLWIAAQQEGGRRIAYVYDIMIRPGYRRMGHAARALAAAEAEARSLGLCGMALHVFGHNGPARALYEKLGYRTTNVNMFKPL